MKILIVEDEINLAKALVHILEENNYSVDAVYNGEDGLDYALSGIYDVIVLDIMLPKINGIQILKSLRNAKIITPIILLTAKSELNDKIQGLDNGADDYLTKPFESKELLARIRALARRKREMKNINEFSFGDLVLDVSTGELICSSKSIKLGLKEIHIMNMLIINARRITTKEQLIETVWGFDSQVEYNNVEVYISFLRKKIKHIDSLVNIKTSRGLGYYLE